MLAKRYTGSVGCTAAQYSNRDDELRHPMTLPDLDRAGTSGSALPVPHVRDEEVRINSRFVPGTRTLT